MTWRYPTEDLYVPPGGEFMSRVLENGKRRTLPHSGLDYSHWAGSPIYVIGPGVVVARGTNARTGWGYHVWVDHGDIGDGRHAYSYYAHMKALGPTVGTRFDGGETIGHIGATGSGLTAAHLHWGVALARPADLYKVTLMNAASRDYLTDPARFVAARMAATAGGGTDPFPGIDHALLRRQKEGIMFVHGIGAPDVAYEGFTDANGKFRLRTCSPNQSAIVIGSGLSVQINDDRLTQLGVEAGGATPAGELTIVPKVDAQVTSGAAEIPAGLATKADVDEAAARVIGAIPTAEQNGAAARAAIVR